MLDMRTAVARRDGQVREGQRAPCPGWGGGAMHSNYDRYSMTYDTALCMPRFYRRVDSKTPPGALSGLDPWMLALWDSIHRLVA